MTNTLNAKPVFTDIQALVSIPVISELLRRHQLLGRTALVFFVATLPVLLAMQWDTRTINDISPWIKPVKFLLSLGVYFATLAWFSAYVPNEWSKGIAGRWIPRVAITLGSLEMLWLVSAAIVGVPSHYNRDSVNWSIAYSLAGVGAVGLLVMAGVQAWAIAKNSASALSPAFHTSVVLGSVVAVVGTLITAGILSSGAGHWVGGVASDANGLPLVGWATQGGDLRVAHFWALHAQQILPFVVWLAADRMHLFSVRTPVILLAVAYSGLIVWVFMQALAGRPFVG